ncbi:golgin subfamily A member 7 isoform X1 [Acinonyx jubatus]|uniref:Golgin subfamily A member 7 n=1 Tax=Acinonyx jubatus TaxID=32536 RepID=A0A6J2AAY5_ACIJB|nr:golgin subfamily A member 7 isoform X1 [Acinonyx jubatus]XP_026926976.1 golgin subfamily A member 7 isoform X1 [Acinonyx jubatus]XP_053072516.1 golgin subfamily A member 7 isoform X1 [Acinonyx jubatus]
MRPQQAPVSGKVFIQRDYSSGTRCQFQTKFPAELENRIDRQQFEETVRTLNNLYAEAEKLGGQSYLEGCLACLTAYTIFLCMETHYEKIPPPAGTLIYPLADRRVSPTSSPEHHSFVSAARATVPFTPRTNFLKFHTWSGLWSLSIHFVSPNCVGLCNLLISF